MRGDHDIVRAGFKPAPTENKKNNRKNHKPVEQIKHKSTKGGKGVVLQEKGISKLGLDINESEENPLRRTA
ncbi:MAG TPA: hypothetical protein ACFYEK_03610 [Candidatus Wunengus sp. YC60]|uniref:hypothetical protein n=1 Tax=Candidatus Wunengus sp. YC60 TaxID=3367697 RepID=UPI00402959C4